MNDTARGSDGLAPYAAHDERSRGRRHPEAALLPDEDPIVSKIDEPRRLPTH